MRGLPLALATAGSYLSKSNWTFGQYLQAYEQRWNISPRRPLQLHEYRDRTLYTTWNISYVRLEEQDADAAQLLKLLAYFDNQIIWFDLMHAGLSDDSPNWLAAIISSSAEFDSVMRVLVDYCFVQSAAQSYNMHSCVHDWTLAELNKSIEPRSYWYALKCVANSIAEKDWSSLREIRYAHLAPHAVRLTNTKIKEIIETIPVNQSHHVDKIIKLLSAQSQLEAAVSLRVPLLLQCEQEFGPEDILTLAMVNNLAFLYDEQGKLGQAEQMYTRAMNGLEKLLGPEHIASLETVNNLGVLYWEQGKLDQAEQMYTRAMNGCIKLFGPEHVSTLRTINNLGLIYDDRGKFDQAEQMYTQALAGKEKALGPEHLSTLDTLDNLGTLYWGKGELDKAEQMCNRALVGKEKALGREHQSTLETASNLGAVYEKQGKLDLAEQMYTRVMEGFEARLGPQHPLTQKTARLLSNLSNQQQND